MCILDEDDYVDVTERNYRKFVKAASLGTPRMKIKVMDGTSPAVHVKLQSQTRTEVTENVSAKKELVYETKLNYMSPSELDIKEKETEHREKLNTLEALNIKYQELSKDMNTHVWRDRSKRICHNCHARKGHDRKRCFDQECTDVRVCGEVDLHPESKKELSLLGAKKQKLEGELNALSSELEAKKKARDETYNTFEGKVQSWLIRSNPEKYLIAATGQVRQVRVNADTAILKKVLECQVPDDIEKSSKFWPDIIENYECKYIRSTKRETLKTPIINPVRRELESRGLTWPAPVTLPSTPSAPHYLSPSPYSGFPQMAFGFPYNTPPFYMLNPGMTPTRPTATVTSSELEKTDVYPPLPCEPYLLDQPPLPQEEDVEVDK